MTILRSNYLFLRFALLVFNFLIITDLMHNSSYLSLEEDLIQRQDMPNIMIVVSF